MTRVLYAGEATTLVALTFAAIAAARADVPAPAVATPEAAGSAAPWRVGGECFASGALEGFHGVSIHAFDLRLGVGGRQAGQGLLDLQDLELGALFIVGGQIGSTAQGLRMKAGHLGVGVRGRAGRVTAGLDAEAIVLAVTRRSTSGDLLGTGFLARALLGFDLLQLGTSALYLGLEGSLAMIGSSDDRYLPAAQAGLGFRW